ncbi:hypothetical protein [Collimonas humicola]|uniref:hypothetical protein n=1 Tax=Collimonas humicola TaxID=2825886 RepID=UPI001B8B6F63|nr:hypothetical protein [Collimonas humicola]
MSPELPERGYGPINAKCFLNMNSENESKGRAHLDWKFFVIAVESFPHATEEWLK